MKKILFSIAFVLLSTLGFSQQTKNVSDSTTQLYAIDSHGDTVLVLNSRYYKAANKSRLSFLYDSVFFAGLNLTNAQIIAGLGYAPAVNPDWNSGGGLSFIYNKPNLFSGQYADLTGSPSVLSQFFNDVNFTTADGYAELTNKVGDISMWSNNVGYVTANGTIYQYMRGDGTLDLFPTIDWNATIGSLGFIVNKPTALSQFYNDSAFLSPSTPAYFTNKTGNISMWNNNVGYLTNINNSQVLAALGFTPYNSSNPSGFISSINNSMIVTALGYTPINPNGSTSQYFRGDGSKATFPTIPAAQIQSDWAQASSGSVDFIKNKPTIPSTVVTSVDGVTRSITGTTYTISSTQAARVYYTIEISCTASIGSSSVGNVLFQYSVNGGTTWIDGGEVKNSNTVTLAIALNSVNVQRGVIPFEVPANALCRMTQSSTGTTTISYIRGSERLYN